MDALTLSALLATCAPLVHPATAAAIVDVESGSKPYAIGVVAGTVVRQPSTRAEATATLRMLETQGWNYSAGLGQINVGNFDRLGLNDKSVFDACTNLAAMQTVLRECFDRARPVSSNEGDALRRALSCYYSGNFTTGFAHGYVRKVVSAAATARHGTAGATSRESRKKESL